MKRKLNNKGKMFDYLFLSYFIIFFNIKRKIIEVFYFRFELNSYGMIINVIVFVVYFKYKLFI